MFSRGGSDSPAGGDVHRSKLVGGRSFARSLVLFRSVRSVLCVRAFFHSLDTLTERRFDGAGSEYAHAAVVYTYRWFQTSAAEKLEKLATRGNGKAAF